MKDKYLQFVEDKENDVTTLYIYGDIRKGSIWEKIYNIQDDNRTGAVDFRDKLNSVNTSKLEVRINSNGGSVSEGLAIYNLLKTCGKEVTTICDGYAASAASVIFCAGSRRIQPKTALLMIHNAWTYGEGNAAYFRKLADDLDTITQPSVEAYKAVSNLSEDKIKELMNNETWITADDALEYGFATDIGQEEPKQSAGVNYMYNLVIANKELSAKLEEMKTKMPKEPELTGWDAFFNKNSKGEKRK